MAKAKRPSKRAQVRTEKSMDEAPRDSTLIELIPKRGNSFIGYFNASQDGWADWGDLVPLIRRDEDFTGWRPRRPKKASPKKAL